MKTFCLLSAVLTKTGVPEGFEAISHSSVPNTGDRSNLTLWLILSLVTVVLLIVALIIGMKKGVFTRKYIDDDGDE